MYYFICLKLSEYTRNTGIICIDKRYNIWYPQQQISLLPTWTTIILKIRTFNTTTFLLNMKMFYRDLVEMSLKLFTNSFYYFNKFRCQISQTSGWFIWEILWIMTVFEITWEILVWDVNNITRLFMRWPRIVPFLNPR